MLENRGCFWENTILTIESVAVGVSVFLFKNTEELAMTERRANFLAGRDPSKSGLDIFDIEPFTLIF